MCSIRKSIPFLGTNRQTVIRIKSSSETQPRTTFYGRWLARKGRIVDAADDSLNLRLSDADALEELRCVFTIG